MISRPIPVILSIALVGVLVSSLVIPSSAASEQGITGLWTGTVEIPGLGHPAEVQMQIVRNADGQVGATVVLDDPGGQPLTADLVTFVNGVLRMEFSAHRAVVEGALSADGQRIEGTASQGDISYPLTLRRSEPSTLEPEPDPGAEAGVGGSAFHKNDITYSTEVMTPHVDWANALADGPIRGFFIPSVQYGRDMVELMQRLDLIPTTVSIDREWDINCWGIGDYYGHNERGDRDDFREVYGYVERDLTGSEPFEVMVIPGLNGWSRMTRASRDAILRRVEGGAGLVLIHPFVGDVKGHPFAGDEAEADTRLWEISPLVECSDDTVRPDGYPELNLEAITRGRWEIAQPHFITRGVPVELLPEGVIGGRFYKYRATGDVLVRSGDYPIVAVKRYGKGRVVSLAYVEQGFMPEPVDPVATRIYWGYWEYQYALLARCILWAAGRESDLSVGGTEFGDGRAEFRLTATTARTVELDVTCESAFGSERRRAPTHVAQTAWQLQPGDNRLEVPIEAQSLGTNIFNLIVRDAETGATLDWAVTTYELPQPATLTALTPGDTLSRIGDTLRVSVSASGDVSNLSFRFEVSDDLARILCSEVRPATTEAAFEYHLADFLGRYAYVAVQLVGSDGLVVDQLRAAPVYIAPAKRRDREYRASLGFVSVRPYFSAVRLQLMNAAGVQAGTTWTEGVDNGLDIPHSYFGVYWYRRGPTTEEALDEAIVEFERTQDMSALAYNTRVELYRRTKDKRFLARDPCFDDPAVVKDLYDRCYASAKAKAGRGMDYYFVGDEGSLTSYRDEFDFCWDSHTLTAFREWLKTEYGSLEALNLEWKANFTDWQSVMPFTTDEAVASGNYPPWADHRTYMEIAFARGYQTVRDAVVAADPDGHIAVSGTQSTSAYNGCDWYRLDQVIDDFLSYGGGNQWDLHRCFAKPGAMIGFWTGYGSSGLEVQHAIWDAAIHDVLYPNIFWIYSYLDPDFTYSNSARDMGEAFKALRLEGVGRLFAEGERLQDGIALHYSMPSIHALTVYEKSHPAEDGLRSISRATSGWVRMVNNLAMQFDFVSYEQLEEGALASDRYRAFIMPLSVALSSDEMRAIQAFAESGGIVIADAGAGTMDDHCAWADEKMMNDFFGIATLPSEERLLARVSGPVTVTPEGETWGLRADTLQGVDAVENISATSGKALMRVGESDAAVVRQVGAGWAVYLNVGLDRYGRWRRQRSNDSNSTADTGPAYESLVRNVLAHLQIRPTVQVLDASGESLAQAQVVRYRLGDSEVLAVLTASAGAEALEGRDGVTIYRDGKLGTVARQEITVCLPQRYFVANARTGERLGYTDVINTSVMVGDALILGLSKSLNEVEVSGLSTARLGETPEFTIRTRHRDTDAPSPSQPCAEQSEGARSVLRCHFFAPDGSLLPSYARNVVMDGDTARIALPSAVNDPPGDYTLQVTDVITGASASAKIRLH